MSDLENLQRQFAAAVMLPLTRDERMRRANAPVADGIVKPNSRLTSFERLEIYNRQYWFRILGSFAEDFPGLRAVVGQRRFDAIAKAYLRDCPSVSFTLRNLGSRLPEWLQAHPQFAGERTPLAMDMVRLEWAHIEAFDNLAKPRISPEHFEAGVALQPYVKLVRAHHAVDDLLIEIRQAGEGSQRWRTVAQYERLPEPVFMAVHRLDNSVYYKRLPAEAFAILSAIEQGSSLDDALDAGFERSTLTDEERLQAVQQWFANWAELGWLCAS